jgi:hypothetical protein
MFKMTLILPVPFPLSIHMIKNVIRYRKTTRCRPSRVAVSGNLAGRERAVVLARGAAALVTMLASPALARHADRSYLRMPGGVQDLSPTLAVTI